MIAALAPELTRCEAGYIVEAWYSPDIGEPESLESAAVVIRLPDGEAIDRLSFDFYGPEASEVGDVLDAYRHPAVYSEVLRERLTAKQD